MTIGRTEDNDIALDTPNVSRHHARIESDGITYRVTDLDSTTVAPISGTPGCCRASRDLVAGPTAPRWRRLLRLSSAGTGRNRPPWRRCRQPDAAAPA